MAYQYVQASRASEKHALPDVETFYHEHAKRERCALNAGSMAERFGECIVDDEGDCYGTGWYYQYGLPGCLGDSDPSGPYATEAEALAAAREASGLCAHGMGDDEACAECDELTIQGTWGAPCPRCESTGPAHRADCDGGEA